MKPFVSKAALALTFGLGFAACQSTGSSDDSSQVWLAASPSLKARMADQYVGIVEKFLIPFQGETTQWQRQRSVIVETENDQNQHRDIQEQHAAHRCQGD